jgi:hypothetical protein
MEYAPHLLYKKKSNVVRNQYGEIDESTGEWVLVGGCRCDDNTTQHFETENGEIYTPQYKIVCDKCSISEGDRVKVLEKDEKTYRGGGKVFNCPKCNYLNYMTIYV